MITYKALDYGIAAGKDVGVKLNELLSSLAAVDDEKTLIFEGGDYYINSATCPKRLLYITNTMGDNEWKSGETPHLNNVAINFQNIKNLIVQGNGSRFIMHGQVTNIALSDCENVELRDFALATVNPDMHELEVIKKGLFTIDFRLDAESQYVLQSGEYYFKGQDYKVQFIDSRLKAHWIGKINKNNPERLKRVGHPLMGAYKIVELSPHIFRAYYIIPHSYKLKDCFYLFDVRRKYVGIFAERSKNIKLDKISQHFNYSLGLVCQDSENIDMKNCNFSPEKGSQKLLASVADFIQICNCRGNVNIDNNNFMGSGDDCINTHGIHFKITKLNSSEITVKFSHRQTHGFNPLRVGDTIRFINPDTLLGDKTAKILESTQLGEYEILLKLSSINGAIIGDVIEDIDACPNLTFSNNTMSRIITRGVLVTTSGKVVIKNNRFEDTYMNSILISDDAKSWYESGNVADVTICDNTFINTPAYNVCIKPENGSNTQAVHNNIVIENNIMSTHCGGISVKCANGVLIKNNKNLKIIKIKNSQVKVLED